jgi:hypothetical protein
MKKILFVFLAVCMIVLSACTKEGGENTFAYGELFELDFGTFKTSDDGLVKLSFDTIEDSRCPLNVICVWEGQAEVTFKVTFSDEEPADLKLINRVGYPELGIDTLGNYIFTLEEVLPYPEEPNELDDEDYFVKMKVEEL